MLEAKWNQFRDDPSNVYLSDITDEESIASKSQDKNEPKFELSKSAEQIIDRKDEWYCGNDKDNTVSGVMNNKSEQQIMLVYEDNQLAREQLQNDDS